MLNGFFSKSKPVTGPDLIESEKQALSSLAKDKERIIESYNQRIEVRQGLLKEVEDKITKVQEIFKAEYTKQENAFALRQEQLEWAEKDLASRNRAFKKDQAEFQVALDQFHKDKDIKIRETLDVIQKNKGLLDEVNSHKERLNQLIDKNNETIRVIDGLRADFKNEELEIADRYESVHKLEGETRLLNQKAHEEADKAANELKDALALSAESIKQKADADARIVLLNSMIEENENKVNAVVEKITINEKKLAEINTKLRQIDDDEARVAQEITALKAKEIFLNEKDRSVSEREKNVKIIEAKTAVDMKKVKTGV